MQRSRAPGEMAAALSSASAVACAPLSLLLRVALHQIAEFQEVLDEIEAEHPHPSAAGPIGDKLVTKLPPVNAQRQVTSNDFYLQEAWPECAGAHVNGDADAELPDQQKPRTIEMRGVDLVTPSGVAIATAVSCEVLIALLRSIRRRHLSTHLRATRYRDSLVGAGDARLGADDLWAECERQDELRARAGGAVAAQQGDTHRAGPSRLDSARAQGHLHRGCSAQDAPLLSSCHSCCTLTRCRGWSYHSIMYDGLCNAATVNGQCRVH